MYIVKSWRHYDVINPWISNLGKISIQFSESSENFQEDDMVLFTITMIKRIKYWNKGLEIEYIGKSWRHYDVINPWISNLGKISI